MTDIGHMFLAFSVLEIIFESQVTLWQTKVQKKEFGRGCICFNESGFSATNDLISFLLCLAFNMFGDQRPCGIQNMNDCN